MADDYESPTLSIFRAMNNYDAKPNDYQTTMAENPAGPSDYDGFTHGKLCPLKAAEPPVLTIWNSDPEPDLTEALKAGAIKCRADGEPPRVEYICGKCDGPRCAVLYLARNK